MSQQHATRFEIIALLKPVVSPFGVLRRIKRVELPADQRIVSPHKPARHDVVYVLVGGDGRDAQDCLVCNPPREPVVDERKAPA